MQSNYVSFGDEKPVRKAPVPKNIRESSADGYLELYGLNSLMKNNQSANDIMKTNLKYVPKVK